MTDITENEITKFIIDYIEKRRCNEVDQMYDKKCQFICFMSPEKFAKAIIDKIKENKPLKIGEQWMGDK